MNPGQLVLQSSLPVRAEPRGAGEGRLGPLLIDRDEGSLFALTCAQVLPATSTLVVATGPLAGTPLSEGPPIIGLHETDNVQDCDHLIAAVPLRQLRIGFDAYPFVKHQDDEIGAFTEPKGIQNSSRWIGHEMHIHSGRGASKRARVVSADSHFAMPSPLNERLTTFDNALELKPIDGDPLVLPGEVGSLVTTTKGDWIAIVIAGRANVAFAAPVRPIMSRLGLSIIGVKAIEAHNRRLDAGRERILPRDRLSDVSEWQSEEAREAASEADRALAV